MSQTIDSRVVQMQFDNHQFESGASQSIGTLKNLDKALKGMDGAQAFANISKAAGNVDLSGITSGVQALQERFSVMGTFLHNTLLGMVESAVNAGKQIANALVFNPAKSGFAEYELQLNSTQRILANTKSKGEDIRSVNAALDELNEYADLTIYNFSQMTDNIGRFTAAGVGLKDSTTAIKGLSNAAALFGADSMAASRAGYQLSQALAAGSVKLMDWNSLVNASMGGEQMQTAIMRVARHHGVAIDAMIEKEGSFRETLSSGWLTTDIMLEALSHFTMANDEASRSALKAAGYTQEEIDAIVELGETATESATVVKTASQLFDTLGEELGSVWAQTWRSIMGDYEEAKSTFSAMHEELSGIVDAWADAQTALVEGWADLGGRTDLFDSVFNVFEALKNVLGPIGQAFTDVFPPVTSERLADMTLKLKEFTQGLILNEDQMNNLRETATTVFTAIKNVLTPIGKVASVVFKTLNSAFKLAANLFGKAITSISKGINSLQGFSNPISGFISKFEQIPKALDNLRIKMDSGFLAFLPKFGDSFSDTIKNVGGSISDVGKTFAETIKNAFTNSESFLEGLKTAMTGMVNIFGSFGEVISTLVSGICESVSNFWLKLTGIDFAAVPNAIKKAFSWLINGGAANILKALTAFRYYNLAGFLSKHARNITTVLDLIKSPIKTFVDWFEKISFKSIPKKFGNMLQGIANEQNSRAIRNLAVSIALLAGSLLILSSIPWDKMKVGLAGFAAVVGSLIGVIVLLAKVGGSLTATTESFRASFTKGLKFDKTVSTNLYSLAAALIAFGAAVLIMAKALKTLSEIGSWESLGIGVAGLVAVAGSLAGSMALLGKFGGKVFARATLSILAIGLCIKMLSGVVTELANLSLTKAAQGVGAIVVILGALSGALVLIGNLGKVSLRSSVAMVAITAAIKVMADVVEAISKLELANAAQGIGALVIMTGALVGLLIAASKTGKPALSASIAILAVSKFMSQLGETLTVMARVAAKNPIEAAVSLLAIMAVIAEVMLLMQKMPKKGGLGTAASLLAMGTAIGILAASLKLLSTANPLTLAANLILLGTAIAALAVSSKLLGSAIPALAKLGIIFVEIGAGAALFAGAMAVVNVALLALSSTIAIAAGSIIANAPLIGQALLAVVQMALNTIVSTADQIAEALFALILAVLGRIREAIPQIIEQVAMTLVEGMSALIEYVPQMVDALMNFLIQVLDAVIPRIPELMGKIKELLGAVFDGLSAIFVEVSADKVKEVGAMIAAVIGVGAILGKFSGIFTSALVGIGELVVLIAEIGAVLVAFGELNRIPGLSEMITSGGDLLSKIGYAIGNFVGSIIGGLGAGATSGLLEIAANLSAFATGVQPFITAMKSGGGDLLGAVEDVAAAMMVLVGADFLSGIAKFLGGGGTSLASFGEQLVGFATPFRQFCDKLQGIDVAAVTGGAQAAKALAEMMETLSTAGGGGLEELIFGDGISLTDFGEQIVDLGDCLRTASTAFTGVDSAAILAAVPAAQALTDLAKDMPRKGGWIDKIAGEQVDLATFGTQVTKFGEALATASTAFTDVDSAAIEAAIPAAQALADLAKDMPRKGGWIDTVIGEQVDLPSFGAQVTAFGEALSTASTIMDGVDSQAILDAVEPAEALATLAQSMVKTGGWAQKISGENMDLATFGADVQSFGESMKAFSESLTGISDNIGTKTDTIVSAMESLGSLKEKVPDLANLKEGINRIAGMKDAFVSFGESIVALSGALVGVDATVIQNAQTATECIKAIATTIPSQEEIDAIPDLSGIQTKFESMAESIKTFGESLGEIDPSQISGATAAFDEIITLVNRINSINVSSFSGLAEAFKKAATNAVEGFKTTISGANVSSIVDSFFASAKNSALANTGALVTAFTKPITDANQSVKNLSPQFSATGKALIVALGQGVSSNKSSVITAFTTAITSAKASVSGMSNTFYRTGADLVQGLINGINSKKQAAIQAGTELGNAVSNATRNATQVRSPSKVFFQIGNYLVQGLALGIIQNAARAINASRGLANDTIAAMQEELKINSPSKVAKDEVGNWIVEGIADGIEENMSAEEAAAKKAENIIAAFQTALDAIDLQFQTRDIDRKIAQIMDVSGASARALQESTYKDELSKASQAYEYKKGAYDTIVKELGQDSDEAVKAYNEMQQAYYDMLTAQRAYESYLLSNEDKYTIADKIQDNAEKEFEIWKNANPWASDSEISKKEAELKKKTSELAKQKATDAASYYYAALKVYGENDTRTIDAYSQYLDAQKEYTETVKADVDKTSEYYKTEAELGREWYEFWTEFQKSNQAEIESGMFTMQQVAKAWGDSYNYDPLTGKRYSEANDILKQIDDAGKAAMDTVAAQILASGQTMANGVSAFTQGAAQACSAVATTMQTGLYEAGSNAVSSMCTAMASQTPNVINTGNQIMSVISDQVVPANMSSWIQAGLDLVNAIGEGVKLGESALTATISTVVQQAINQAMSSVTSLLSGTQNGPAPKSGSSKNISYGSESLIGSLNAKDIVHLSEAAKDHMDEATMKWLEENPQYTGTLNLFWSFDSAKEQGHLQDWMRDEQGNIVKLGEAIGEGIAQGVTNSTDTVEKATDTMINVVPDTVESNLEINSPSRVMERFGRYVDAGLANGITNNVGLVSTAAITMLDTLSTEVEEGIETPEVVPVIDLDSLKHEVELANKMLGRVSIDKVSTVAGTIQNGKSGHGQRSDSKQEIVNNNFTQNNYSPKALSNATIYRQTKNQFAMFARKKG